MDTVASWNMPLTISAEKPLATLDSDAQLMLQFQSGDLEAFEALFAKHSRSLVNFAYRFVRNIEIAEELAQEIFMRVHDAASTYRAEAKFTTWLYRIATNVCLNELRRPQFRAVHQSLELVTPEGEERPLDLEDARRTNPHDRLEQEAIGRILRNALDHLPEKQRVAFVLNKYQDLSYSEVSDVMGISEKAVKSLIHRAKEGLAARLRPMLPELLVR